MSLLSRATYRAPSQTKAFASTAPTSIDSAAQTESLAPRLCFHCLEAVPRYVNISTTIDGLTQPMCCLGCKAAAEFIDGKGLSDFYVYRDDTQPTAPVFASNRQQQSRSSNSGAYWRYLDNEVSDDPKTGSVVRRDKHGCRYLVLQVSGLYCSSCSWLIDAALRGVSDTVEVSIDVSTQTVRIKEPNPDVALSELVATVSRLGYSPDVVGVNDRETEQRLSQLRRKSLQRIVVAGLGTMQVMTYAVAGYVGADMPAEYAQFFRLVSMLVATVVVFYSGKPFFTNALNDLRNRHLGMDVPVAIAIGAAYCPSVYLTLWHQPGHLYFDSAVMFVFFLSLGRYVEMNARHKLSGSASEVNQLLPDEVVIQRTEGNRVIEHRLKPSEVQVGDQTQLTTQLNTTQLRTQVRTGNKGVGMKEELAEVVVPFDSRIIGGTAELDESLITGESVSVSKRAGDTLLAGTVLLKGTLVLEANRLWQESSIMHIQRMLESANSSREQEVKRSQALSQYFIVSVLVLTSLVAMVWFVYQPERVFEICLAMLVASCPCAFSLAGPVGRSAAIHALKKVGVLITGSEVLESVRCIDTWCFDKTGTLTQGRPVINDLVRFGSMSAVECLQRIASIERHSKHVLSRAFADTEFTDTAMPFSATDVKEHTGKGITARIDGVEYMVGNRYWVQSIAPHIASQLPAELPAKGSELVFATVDTLLSIIVVSDPLRPSAQAALAHIDELEQDAFVLSGDNHVSVASSCDALPLVGRHANLQAADKQAMVKELQRNGKCVAMIGDGVNDAPVLAQADVSVALASGSELSLNNADVIIVNGDLRGLGRLHQTAQFAARITRQNLNWAVAYNVLALPLAALGFLTPWLAAIGMSLSSLLVVLNALRIINKPVSITGKA